MNTPASWAEPDLERLLSRGSLSAAELIKLLGVSQPTFSRIIQGQSRVLPFRVSGQRTPLYGWLRPLAAVPETGAGQKVYRIDECGTTHLFGDVWFLSGGGTFFKGANGNSERFDGLPPWMAHARPSGFLGRYLAARHHEQVAAPGTLKDWSDDHHISFLLTCAPDTPGNLVFGDESLARMLQRNAQEQPIPAASRSTLYEQWAQALANQPIGSSAGGEQPKFACEIEDLGHVLVKFAKNGTRMADLLRLEDLALRTLTSHGVAAACSSIHVFGAYTFLECVRFDRVGRTGRAGMIAAGALDDELFGKRDSWAQFAARCMAARLLNARQVEVVHVLASFSAFIGNTDTHFENLSLLIAADGKIQDIAPAYDILPMCYAPLAGGVEPDLLPIQPRVAHLAGQIAAWKRGAEIAQQYWSDAMGLFGASHPMRSVVAQNLDVVRKAAGAF